MSILVSTGGPKGQSEVSGNLLENSVLVENIKLHNVLLYITVIIASKFRVSLQFCYNGGGGGLGERKKKITMLSSPRG